MGERSRLFHERAELEERQQRGDPIQFDEIPLSTRKKIGHWLVGTMLLDVEGYCRDALEVLQRGLGYLPGKNAQWKGRLHEIAVTGEMNHVWSLVEAVAICGFQRAGRSRTSVARELQLEHDKWKEFNVFLGDEFLGHRLVWDDREKRYHVRRIDSEVLHREIVDRTFQITRAPEFVAADEHYQTAWKHYSKGDHADAITNAAKAMESALKVVLAKMDSTIRTDNLSASDLFRELFNRDFLPETMRPVLKQLRTIYEQAAPPLRNDTAHGDVKVFAPDGPLTLLVLNLVGSLIVFSVQAHANA